MNTYCEINKTDNKQKANNTFFGTNKRANSFIQPKLTINQPNDPYEQEADAMADKVMRMKQPGIQLKPMPISSVQRKCAHCEEEDKEIQRKEMNGAEKTGESNLESYVDNLGDGGQSLPNEVREFYEPKFGYDFSNVKVYTDNVAAKSAQSINALAYTSGNNIVFNNGQYAPGSDSGKRLLGHELTHVVQQGKGIATKAIQRLVRTSLVTCPAGQNPFSADRKAVDLLTNAISLIDSAVAARPGNLADPNVLSVGNAMHTAFRLNAAIGNNWNDAAPHFGIPLIRRRLEAAKNYIDSVVFTINCIGNGANYTIPGCAVGTCNAGTEAFTCPDNPREIVLCPDFWALSVNQRARTYMHEIFHVTFQVINDWGQPDQHNAHCYAQFVALVNGFNSPAGFRCH